VGQIERLLSWNIYSRRELDNSSKPNQIRAKAAARKTLLLKKELFTLSLGDVAEES
jgi:hypothetical protein